MTLRGLVFAILVAFVAYFVFHKFGKRVADQVMEPSRENVDDSRPDHQINDDKPVEDKFGGWYTVGGNYQRNSFVNETVGKLCAFNLGWQFDNENNKIRSNLVISKEKGSVYYANDQHSIVEIEVKYGRRKQENFLWDEEPDRKIDCHWSISLSKRTQSNYTLLVAPGLKSGSHKECFKFANILTLNATNGAIDMDYIGALMHDRDNEGFRMPTDNLILNVDGEETVLVYYGDCGRILACKDIACILLLVDAVAKDSETNHNGKCKFITMAKTVSGDKIIALFDNHIIRFNSDGFKSEIGPKFNDQGRLKPISMAVTSEDRIVIEMVENETGLKIVKSIDSNFKNVEILMNADDGCLATGHSKEGVAVEGDSFYYVVCAQGHLVMGHLPGGGETTKKKTFEMCDHCISQPIVTRDSIMVYAPQQLILYDKDMPERPMGYIDTESEIYDMAYFNKRMVTAFYDGTVIAYVIRSDCN